MCYLRLYVKGHGRGVPSKSAIFNNVVFAVFQRTPPIGFVRSASKFFSKLTRCNLRKVVLFVTLHQRAWPWRAIKVGSVVFFPMFVNKLLPGNWSVLLQNQSVHSKDVLNKPCAFCDCTSKGVALAFRQSWFCGLFFQSL